LVVVHLGSQGILQVDVESLCDVGYSDEDVRQLNREATWLRAVEHDSAQVPDTIRSAILFPCLAHFGVDIGKDLTHVTILGPPAVVDGSGVGLDHEFLDRHDFDSPSSEAPSMNSTAAWKMAGSRSMPMPRRPAWRAARMEAPEPMQGSSTV